MHDNFTRFHCRKFLGSSQLWNDSIRTATMSGLLTMKCTVNLIVLLIGTLSAMAQGTTYLSNLDQAGSGFYVGGGNQSFQTGAAAGGYLFNSVTFLMGNSLGYSSNFVTAIYSD